MKIQVKEFVDGKWSLVPTEKLVGTSICKYLIENNVSTVAAAFDNDKPFLFISNTEEMVQFYKEKGTSVLATEILEIFGTEVVVEPMSMVFDGSFLIEKRGTSED